MKNLEFVTSSTDPSDGWATGREAVVCVHVHVCVCVSTCA